VTRPICASCVEVEHGLTPVTHVRKNAAGKRVTVTRLLGADVLAVEMIASYGMAVGASVFDTCIWIGRFVQAWDPRPHALVYRRDVKLHLCGSARAKDANVRQALLDLYGDGTRQTACGVKSKPGPLYGIKKDEYQAGANNKTLLKQIADLEALARKVG
jgi:hypothetical protein